MRHTKKTEDEDCTNPFCDGKKPIVKVVKDRTIFSSSWCASCRGVLLGIDRYYIIGLTGAWKVTSPYLLTSDELDAYEMGIADRENKE